MSEKRPREWRPTRRASMAYFVWRLMLAERVKLSRDTVLLSLGAFLIVYPVVVIHPPSVELVTVGAGLLSGPLILRADERRRGKTRDEED